MDPDSPPRRALPFSAFPAGFLLLLSLLLLGISLLFLPPLWTSLHAAVMKDGNSPDAGKIVTAMWTGKPFHLVSTQLKIGDLGPRETAHYDDIRTGFRVVLGATIFLFGLLLSLSRAIPWRAATAWSLLLFTTFTATLGIWAAIDWRHFFRTLHWWVFQDNSWVLPTGSPSLLLFPYPVWQWAFALLAAAILITHLLLLAVTSFRRR